LDCPTQKTALPGRNVELSGAVAARGLSVERTESTNIPGMADERESSIAFWAESPADVDRIAKIAAGVGARDIEGPMNYEPGHYAVFFEDPCGNGLEICHRLGT